MPSILEKLKKISGKAGNAALNTATSTAKASVTPTASQPSSAGPDLIGAAIGKQAPKNLAATSAGLSGLAAAKSEAQQRDRSSVTNKINQKIQEGYSPDQAVTTVATQDYELGAKPEHNEFKNQSPRFAEDPGLQSSVLEREISKEALDSSKNELMGKVGELRNKWDKSVSKNLDTLSLLSGDPRYMEWLGTLDISAGDILSLNKGRQSYIEDFKSRMRENFGNDLAYMDNLKTIEKQAEADYMRKSKIVADEINRLSNSKDVVMGKSTDNQGNVTMILQNPTSGEIYTRSFSGIGASKDTGSQIDIFGGSQAGGDSSIDPRSVLANLQGQTIHGDQKGTGKSRDNPNTSRDEGQCGAFVNDMTGTKLMGNTISEKKAIINSKEPKPGSIFVSTMGSWGHTGFMEKPVGDGSGDWFVIDANRYLDGVVRRRRVNPDKEQIVGYREFAGQGEQAGGVDLIARIDSLDVPVSTKKDAREAIARIQTEVSDPQAQNEMITRYLDAIDKKEPKVIYKNAEAGTSVIAMPDGSKISVRSEDVDKYLIGEAGDDTGSTGLPATEKTEAQKTVEKTISDTIPDFLKNKPSTTDSSIDTDIAEIDALLGL